MPSRIHASRFVMSSAALAASVALAAVLAPACKQRGYNESRGLSESNAPERPLTRESYVAACEKEVGPFPEAMSCFDPDNSHEVTIWRTEDSATRRVGHDIPFDQKAACDNPSPGLSPGQACVPYSRISTYKSGPITWTILCRHFSLKANGPKETKFDAVGMIGHNAATGATCFFDTNSRRGGDGVKVPKPSAPEAAEFFIEPSSMASSGPSKCVTCHTAYPFITTAHAIGVSPGMPDTMQSMEKAMRFLPRNNIKGSYYVVMGKELNTASGRPDTWTPRTLAADKAKACTACHRVGPTPNAILNARAFIDIGESGRNMRGKPTDYMTQFPRMNLHWVLADHIGQEGGVKNLRVYNDMESWTKSAFHTAFQQINDECKSNACAGERTPGEPPAADPAPGEVDPDASKPQGPAQ